MEDEMDRICTACGADLTKPRAVYTAITRIDSGHIGEDGEMSMGGNTAEYRAEAGTPTYTNCLDVLCSRCHQPQNR